MRRRLLLLAAVGLAGALSLAGCNGRSGQRDQPTAGGSPEAGTAPPAPKGPPPTPGPPSTKRPPVAPAERAKALVSNRGVVLPVQRAEPGGYQVQTPCGNTAFASGTPVASATVVLDPGHGGDEPGAVGPNGLSEKIVNLAVAGHAEAALHAQGISAVLTRSDDYRISLATRSSLVLALQPKAFVSIHHNAEPDGPRPGPGTETYYQVASAASKRLAGLVYEEVVKALSAYQVPWVADRDAGAKYRKGSDGDDYYGILRQTKGVPAVLAELAFMSNPAEADLLARPDVQRVEGEAVARGIIRFLQSKDPGSGYVEPYPREAPAGPGGGRVGCVDPPL